MIYYFAYKKSDGWLVLGYENTEQHLARREATSLHPDSKQIRTVGKDSGYPKPLPDQAVILAEELMNLYCK